MRNNDIGFYFKRISDYLAAKANEDLKAMDITFSQMHIVMYLVHQKDFCARQKDIERCFNLKHPTVVGLLRRMENKALVSVEENPDDRRGNIVRALPKAVKLSSQIKDGHLRTDEILTKDLTDEQRRELLKILDIIYHSMYPADEQ